VFPKAESFHVFLNLKVGSGADTQISIKYDPKTHRVALPQ